MTPKELREKRAKLAAEIRRLADLVNAESRDFTAEETGTWERVNNEYNALTRQIDVAERAEEVAAKSAERSDAGGIGRSDLERRGNDAEQRDRDFNVSMHAWFRAQHDMEITDEHREACQRTGINPEQRKLSLRLLDTGSGHDLAETWRDSHPRVAKQRALSAISAAGGGATVSTSFMNRLEVAMLQFGAMLQVAEVIRTTSGEPMSWPSVNDTTNKGRQIEENIAVDTTDTTTPAPAFKKQTWGSYDFTSDGILVPNSLLEDSEFDVAKLIADIIGERIGRILNEKFTTGSGAATPHGIVTASTLGVTAASATAIAADEIIDLQHSVDPAYRTDARFMLHDSILKALRKLKDGEGRYLWESNIRAGVPDTLHGDALTVNQDMDSTIAATKKTMIYGALAKYKVRLVREVKIWRLVERYREYNQDGFMGFVRGDGGLLNAGTNPVKHLVH